jgi:hypothetical protein
MKLALPALTMLAMLMAGNRLLAQTAASTPAENPWTYSLLVDGYIVPDEDGYASPTFYADRSWLHLEARYNYEDLRTGSLWIGRNFSVGHKLVLNLTPMIGGVFGRTTGIAPGLEGSLTYKKIQFSVANEYVFDTKAKSGNFYYAWPQLTYSPWEWFSVGVVEQRTKAYHTGLDTQRGFLVGFSHKNTEFTTYIFNLGWASPTVVLEVGYNF